MSEAPELLPCPKCHGIAELDGQRGYIPLGKPHGIVNSMAVIYCLSCGCELSHECENTANLLDAEYDLVIAELIAAWNTRQAPKVKALEWDDLISDPYWIVINHNGTADLWRAKSVEEDGEVGDYIKGGYLTLVSIEDLKAAAQADYTRRILSALEEWEGRSRQAIKARGRELDGVVHDGYPEVRR